MIIDNDSNLIKVFPDIVDNLTNRTLKVLFHVTY